MQPYFFPYIGYFQLIKASNIFVFYDDVNYIKGGWINRNNFLLNGEKRMITIPLVKASSYKQINEININESSGFRKKIIKSIYQSYSKAPFFDQVFPLFQDVIHAKIDKIAELSCLSVKKICDYLDFHVEFKSSSVDFADNKGLEKSERLLDICRKEDVEEYINPEGGKKLYKKNIFIKEGVNLYFLKSGIQTYPQFNNEFISSLSMIDVMMFNSKQDCIELVNKYTLE